MFSAVAFGNRINSITVGCVGLGAAHARSSKEIRPTSNRLTKDWRASGAFVFTRFDAARFRWHFVLYYWCWNFPGQHQTKARAIGIRDRAEFDVLRFAADLGDHRPRPHRRAEHTISDIGRTLTLLVGGAEGAGSTAIPTSYDAYHPGYLRIPPAIPKLGEYFVRSVTGEMVPLSSVKISINAYAPRSSSSSRLQLGDHLGTPLPGVLPATGGRAL